MAALPCVSVVIPTYGHETFILQTLESVFAQTYTDYEVIVVNDGSPDATKEVLHELAASGKICYREQANQGQAAARNHGISRAQGRFLALLDDDDLWPPDKLARQVELLEQHRDVAVVYGTVVAIDDAGKPIPNSPIAPCTVPVTYESLLKNNTIVSPGQCLIRRSLLPQNRPFDTSLWGCDDWDLWLCLAQNHPFLLENKPALYYRLHDQNASKDLVRMDINVLRLYRKHLRLQTNQQHQQLLARYYHDFQASHSRYWLKQSWQALRAGKVKQFWYAARFLKHAHLLRVAGDFVGRRLKRKP